MRKKSAKMASTVRATATETASYIEEMTREMGSLALANGLDRIYSFLRLARAEARLTAEEG
ncbi:MAG: hypothetical protein ACE5FO_03260 [Parvularculaceae bacterium]